MSSPEGLWNLRADIADESGGRQRVGDSGQPRAEAQVSGVERAASLVLSRHRSSAGDRPPDGLEALTEVCPCLESSLNCLHVLTTLDQCSIRFWDAIPRRPVPCSRSRTKIPGCGTCPHSAFLTDKACCCVSLVVWCWWCTLRRVMYKYFFFLYDIVMLLIYI
jgi:hypothetical protein